MLLRRHKNKQIVPEVKAPEKVTPKTTSKKKNTSKKK
jgi:hypothetical protein